MGFIDSTTGESVFGGDPTAITVDGQNISAPPSDYPSSLTSQPVSSLRDSSQSLFTGQSIMQPEDSFIPTGESMLHTQAGTIPGPDDSQYQAQPGQPQHQQYQQGQSPDQAQAGQRGMFAPEQLLWRQYALEERNRQLEVEADQYRILDQIFRANPAAYQRVLDVLLDATSPGEPPQGDAPDLQAQPSPSQQAASPSLPPQLVVNMLRDQQATRQQVAELMLEQKLNNLQSKYAGSPAPFVPEQVVSYAIQRNTTDLEGAYHRMVGEAIARQAQIQGRQYVQQYQQPQYQQQYQQPQYAQPMPPQHSLAPQYNNVVPMVPPGARVEPPAARMTVPAAPEQIRRPTDYSEAIEVAQRIAQSGRLPY